MTNSSVLEPPVAVTLPGTDVSSQSAAAVGDAPQPPRFSPEDAAELAARRAADAKLKARLHGWKPLTMWYAFWAIVIAIGAISSLAAGQAGAFLLGVALCGGCIKYTHYLYNGGGRRVWLFVW